MCEQIGQIVSIFIELLFPRKKECKGKANTKLQRHSKLALFSVRRDGESEVCQFGLFDAEFMLIFAQLVIKKINDVVGKAFLK